MYGITNYGTRNNVLVDLVQQLTAQFVGFIPKLIVAIIIWILGMYFLGLFVKMVRKLDIKALKPVGKVIDSFAFFILPLGKLLLALVVLDYLGIGRTVISALLNGLSFAIAIALGLSFGKAIEGDVKSWVDSIKKQLEK